VAMTKLRSKQAAHQIKTDHRKAAHAAQEAAGDRINGVIEE
jgi:hypothetical protein